MVFDYKNRNHKNNYNYCVKEYLRVTNNIKPYIYIYILIRDCKHYKL